MLRCYITDRRGLGSTDALLANIERLISDDALDWIQIREKDLPARELLELSRRVVELARRSNAGLRVLINSRMDVALASEADGIHLPSKSPSPAEFKRHAPHLRIGVSCHNQEELEAAEAEGADYAVLGPVYAPLSKAGDGPVLGIERFAELVRQVKIPVLALGGITQTDIVACERAGAAGVAGISLFQRGAVRSDVPER